MAFSIEAIIALISVVVSLPPAVFIILKLHRRYGQKKDNICGMETANPCYYFVVTVAKLGV
jgi:hypothetical protein